MPLIDMEQIENVSKTFRSVRIEPMNLYDSRYYPESNEPLKNVIMYFITMVAMDHRLSKYGKVYQAEIDGKLYRGADLLYRLGKMVYDRNPEFFSPENLAKMTKDDVIQWLSIGEAKPPDPDVRAALLRDIGEKMLKLFNGDPHKVIEISSGFLRKSDGHGFIDLLKIFKAYQDPVEKKAFLLAKFLSYRGILKIVDVNSKRVPVDNHLTRIAIRLGLIELEKHYREMILNSVEVGYEDDVVIRMSVREAYRYLAERASVDPFVLDDYLWMMGRTVCVKGVPQCSRCLFRDVCKAHRENMYLDEHRYENTWYY